MSERELVTIRNVLQIRPIPGADAIECATVDGWEVVVKKSDFQVGDRAVYFEIDSFLPAADPRFEFLKKAGVRQFDGHEGMRLRTIRLRGQLSQGLLLSLKDFPEIANLAILDGDLSSLLNVVKWDPPLPAEICGQMKGRIPSFIRKTDQERIQNLTEILETEKDSFFEVTIKLDGTSMTVYVKDGEFGVCGRNYEWKPDSQDTMTRIAHESGLIKALKEFRIASGLNIAVQGELIGAGIQNNPERLRDQQFYVFDIWDISTQEKLAPSDRHNLLKILHLEGAPSLKHSPVLEAAKRLGDFEGDIHKLLAYADGPSLSPQVKREGVVFKRLDGKLSFKVISNEYLLKEK